MSTINSVRKLQVLYFSKKNKEIKNLKNDEKMGPLRHSYILLLQFETKQSLFNITVFIYYSTFFVCLPFSSL